jgi:hypothetical protein
MADHYDKLTEAEKAYWDIYTRLRELSDWEGFSDAQGNIKNAARDWLVNQRKFIWRCAEGKETPEYKAGWGINNRQARYDQLSDDKLNNGSCRRVCQLPTNGCTASEKSGISEREMWWRVESVDSQTKAWRQSNADWATNRRKQVYHLGEDEGWDEAERELRYENLCIATKTGSYYDDWAKTHNTTTGEKKSSSGGKSSRSRTVDWLESYIGVHENPDGSNKGSPQPSGWQNRVYGDDGVAWCACFAVCAAWDNGVKGTGTAGVWNNTDLAKKGQGIYRGYTTDPSKVHAGDHAFINDDHTGVISDRDTMETIEGNTSNSGSQWNGGSVVRKDRGPGYWTGYGLVDYPDD